MVRFIVAQATTDNTGRGMSTSLLYCDEFAFVRPSIALSPGQVFSHTSNRW